MLKSPANPLFRAIIVFLFFFLMFLTGHLLNKNFSSSDDPYYHAKHAALMAQSGDLVLIKPWLEFHFFNYAPVDPWWGFHLGLASFIYLFGMAAGTKIFVSLLAALVFAVFYLVLNKLKIKYALIWTGALFFASSIFSFRLLLERPHLLSMIVFPLAIYFLIKEKNFWLFILALIYTISYQLSPLIILLACLYSAVEIYHRGQINLKPLIAASGGVLAGILIHPASLNYLYVIYVTLGRILFLKFSGIDLNIGGELQLTGFRQFISNNFIALLFYILAAALFPLVRKLKKDSPAVTFLFLYSSLWLPATLLVPRGVEFWLPAALLFAAAVFRELSGTAELKTIKSFFTDKMNLKVAGFFLGSALVLIIFYNLGNIFFNLYQTGSGRPGEDYRQANDWLKKHSEKDSVVFYDNWGMWPMMFYYNDYNHYIIGMDPTFLYEYDARTYWLWRNISADGLYCDRPAPCLDLSPREQLKLVPLAIKTVFRARYAVVANNQDSRLVKTFNSLRTGVSLVFKNEDLLIYEIL